MNLFELFVKIGVDDQASGKLSDLSNKLGNGLKAAAKIGTAAVGAAASGITALTTAAVNNYAEYEQLVGGVETLFKDSADKVQEYAANAYKTAGMSANEYMSTVTSFSASLLQSLGGDTDKAAEYANQALTDMSDNANKMGTSMEMIQNAYQGFAKQNYTMLDNLKLGYGGTQEEMKRLIADAAKLSDTVDAQDMSFGNIVKAINVVQTEMGITGTTALEAGRTISGSVGAMKAAWTNLVTGLADGNADIGQLVDNLVTTITGDGTENNLGVIGNVLPAVKIALTGAGKLVKGILPKIIQEIPAIIKENLQILAEAAISIVKSLAEGIWENVPSLLETVVDVALQIVNTLTTPEQLNRFFDAALTLVLELTRGIVNAVPNLISAAIQLVMNLINFILDENNLNAIINTALEIIMVITEGLVKAIPQLVDAAITIIEKLCEFFLDPENISMILEMAFRIVVSIVDGLGRAASELVKGAGKLIEKVIEVFKSTDWGQLGKNIVDGLKNGISNAWDSLVSWFKGLFGDLIGIAKKILGIASPSKVFKKIGGFTAEGFGVGFEDEFSRVKTDMENALTFDDASIGINASVRKIGIGATGTPYGIARGGVNVVQNIYSEAKTAADLMQETLYYQERAVLLGV